MATPRCLSLLLDGIECGPDTPDADLCDPCHRARMAQDERSAATRGDAFLAGYAAGYAHGRGRGRYLDLDALADYLRHIPD